MRKPAPRRGQPRRFLVSFPHLPDSRLGSAIVNHSRPTWVDIPDAMLAGFVDPHRQLASSGAGYVDRLGFQNRHFHFSVCVCRFQYCNVIGYRVNPSLVIFLFYSGF